MDIWGVFILSGELHRSRDGWLEDFLDTHFPLEIWSRQEVFSVLWLTVRNTNENSFCRQDSVDLRKAFVGV